VPPLRRPHRDGIGHCLQESGESAGANCRRTILCACLEPGNQVCSGAASGATPRLVTRKCGCGIGHRAQEIGKARLSGGKSSFELLQKRQCRASPPRQRDGALTTCAFITVEQEARDLIQPRTRSRPAQGTVE